MSEKWATASKGFAYRKLTISDFQATALPADMRAYTIHIRAHSCLNIRPSPSFKFAITSATLHGRLFYMGSFDHISIEASFLPECSWWNPRVPTNKKAYVLQHEQIHFALSELTARRTTQQAQKELQGLIVFGNSYQEVKTQLMGKVRDLVTRAMRSDLKEQTAFDEDTSAFYDPQAQRTWLHKVETSLKYGEKVSP